MSKTLLAVDDSATIRKALEITFGGEGYRVLAADNRASALARLADKPDLVLIDTVLGSDDGYALCQEVRAQAPGAAIVLLSSRFNPYDTGRGQAAGADEYCDKPFDTQQLLDKARTVLEAKASQPLAAPPAAAGAPYRAPAEAQAQFRGPTPTPANAIPAAQAPREESRPPSQPAARAQTLVFGSSPVNAQTANPYATAAATPTQQPQQPQQPQQQKPSGPPPIPARQPAAAPPAPTEVPRPQAAAAPPPMPAQPAVAPRPAPTAAPAAPTQQPAAPAVHTAVAAQLGPKLGALGLTKEQADAVLALSREVVERVVWEVVPQLAEVMIREELQRLTKE